MSHMQQGVSSAAHNPGTLNSPRCKGCRLHRERHRKNRDMFLADVLLQGRDEVLGVVLLVAEHGDLGIGVPGCLVSILATGQIMGISSTSCSVAASIARDRLLLRR